MAQYMGQQVRPSAEIATEERVIILRLHGSKAGKKSNCSRRIQMEITTQEFKHGDLVSVKGRVDSATAPDFTKALEKISEAGRFKIAVDMSELEYMSSAG